MIAANNGPLFDPGRLVATPGAIEALEAADQNVLEFVSRHLRGDWGTVDAEDKSLNDQSVSDGSRILSAFVLKTGLKIWIITEAADDDGKRVATTVLLPDEY